MDGLGNWLSDNADWLTGTVVGAIGIAVALLIYFWQRKPKTLDYSVVSNVPLVSHAAGMVGNLEVVYNRQSVKDPRLLVVRIKNTGKVAIVGEDYVEGPSIHFGSPVEVIDAFQVGGSSPNMVQLIAVGHGHGPVEPEVGLLNSGEYFDLQMLLDGDPGDVTASARFKDQNRPMQARDVRDISVIQAMGVVLDFRASPASAVTAVAVVTVLYAAIAQAIGSE